jgi:HK97 family phage major capsid protein
MSISRERYDNLVKAVGQEDADKQVADKFDNKIEDTIKVDKTGEAIESLRKEMRGEMTKLNGSFEKLVVVKENDKPVWSGKTLKSILNGTYRKQTTFNSENNTADGGALIVPELSPYVTQALYMSSLIGKTYIQPVGGQVLYISSVDFPASEAGATSAQGELKTETKLALSRRTITLETIYKLIPVSNELLEDFGQLSSLVVNEGVSGIHRRIENGVINGVGAIAGIVGDTGTVVVPRTTTGKVTRKDIAAMYARMYWQNANPASVAWIMNPLVLPEIEDFRDTFGLGIMDQPGVMRMYGLPIVWSPISPGMGDAGDCVLADLGKYTLGMKSSSVEGGIQTRVSPDVYFQYNLTTYRCECRVAGAPNLPAPITIGGVDYGFMIQLDDASST